jgi:3-oxoacyl-[acyl-carrier-protein] synthase III
MYICAISSAFPENRLNNEFLIRELGFSEEIVHGEHIEARSSILTIEYLKNTKNKRPIDSLNQGFASPTDLAFSAAEKVLSELGISIEEVELVLAATTTQLETIPSESQRLMQRYSRKVPAYDLGGANNPFAAFLQFLDSFKEELLPKYTLCVCTETPTRFINYSNGIEGVYFGDAAFAMIVSREVKGKAKLESVKQSLNLTAAELITIPQFGPLEANLPKFNEITNAQIAKSAKRLDTVLAGAVGYYLAWPDFTHELANRDTYLVNRLGLKNVVNLSVVRDCGYSLGAYVGVSLAAKWGELQGGSTVLAFSSDGGGSFAEVIFSVI